ncbi:MAG: response regulator [Candidatus Nitrosopelagicus sp.]|nr:response regulator [Candidatus Nitrosopelagicus sp.]
MGSKTILIADNDYIMQDQYKNILESHSHKVITCNNGFDAVSKYIEFSPQIILMDIELPKMNGYKTAWQIKEFDKNAIIIFFARQIQINEEYLKVQKKYSIPLYLKPVGVNDLLDIIKKY